LNRLPATLQQKVLAYRRWQDAYASLFGKLLLEMALRKAGLPGDLTGLRTTVYGRPYLEGGPDFNISHSGNRVVCIMSTSGRIGIDLEATGDIAIGDFQSQFTAAEWTTITGSATPVLTFYHYWTAKESLIKADGRGLQIALDSLDISDGQGVRDGPDNNPNILLNGSRWHIRSLPFFPNYACHIACDHPIGNLEVTEIGPEMF
jgi:4'-phosphopantetheinyl transferase